MADPMISATNERFNVPDKGMHPWQHNWSIFWRNCFSIVRIVLGQNTIRRVPVCPNSGSISGRSLRESFYRRGIQSFYYSHFCKSRIFPMILNGYNHLGFVIRSAPTFSSNGTSKECIVHFNHIIQHILGIPVLESCPDLMNHKPSGFVMDFNKSRQQDGRATPFVSSHQIYGPEPFMKRKMGTMEHSVCGKRGLEPTVFALKYFPLRNKVSLSIVASGTTIAVFPSYFSEMFETLFFRLEVFLKLEKFHILVRTHLYLHCKVCSLSMV